MSMVGEDPKHEQPPKQGETPEGERYAKLANMLERQYDPRRSTAGTVAYSVKLLTMEISDIVSALTAARELEALKEAMDEFARKDLKSSTIVVSIAVRAAAIHAAERKESGNG